MTHCTNMLWAYKYLFTVLSGPCGVALIPFIAGKLSGPKPNTNLNIGVLWLNNSYLAGLNSTSSESFQIVNLESNPPDAAVSAVELNLPCKVVTTDCVSEPNTSLLPVIFPEENVRIIRVKVTAIITGTTTLIAVLYDEKHQYSSTKPVIIIKLITIGPLL